MKFMPAQTNGVYLMENQGWEYSLVSQWRENNHGTIIGFPHSTVRFWDLRYFFDQSMFQVNNMEKSEFPAIPDKVAVNGTNTRKSLTRGCWPRERLEEVEALRFLYLGRAHKKKLCPDGTREQTRLLVLGDYVQENTNQLLSVLRDSSEDFPENVHVTFKPHPNCPVISGEAVTGIPMQVTNNDIEHLLSANDIVFTSNLTSAAVDAYCYGLKVISLNGGRGMNLSPLRNEDNVDFIHDSKGFLNALTHVVASQRYYPGGPEAVFFNVDAGLLGWKALLNV